MKIPSELPEVGSTIILTKPIRPVNTKRFYFEEVLPAGLELKVLGSGYLNPYSNNKNWYLVQIVGTKEKYLLNPNGLTGAFK